MSSFGEIEKIYFQQRWGKGDFSVLRPLLDEMDDLDIEDKRGKTLYHLTAQEAGDLDVEFAQYLFDKGVKCRTDENGTSPLHILARVDLAKLDVSKQKQRANNISTLAELFIQAKANYKRKDDFSSGKTPAIYAAESANYPFFETLIKYGAKLDDIGVEGKNLLHILCTRMAALRSNEKFIESGKKTISLIVENNLIDPEDKDIFGTTPLVYLQRANLLAAASILTGETGEGAKTGGLELDKAVLLKNLDAVKALLAQGADANMLSDEFRGRTVLMLACEYPHAEIVATLLAHGADPNYRSGEEGKNCLYYLLKAGFRNSHAMRPNQIPAEIKKILRSLEKNKIDISAPVDDAGNTALHLIADRAYGQACYLNHAELALLDELLEMGEEVNATNLLGQTPLMLFAETGDENKHAIAEALLDAEAEVRLRDKNGCTALHYASRNTKHSSAVKIARLILEKDNSIASLGDNLGKTAMDYAVECNNEALVKLFLEIM